MIKIIKINNGGPLVIGNLDDQTSIHGANTYIVKPAVSIVNEEDQLRLTDLLPFTVFEDGISLPETSVEFISTPSEGLIMEYEEFCKAITDGVKVEVRGEPQLLVED